MVMDTQVNNTASPNSYLDFEGLANLRAQAKQDPKAALRQTAQQFEGLFLQQMMKSMREAVPKSDLVNSSSMEQFQSMFDKEVSVQMSKRNSVGLADMLVKAQGRHMDAVNNASHALNTKSTPSDGLALNPQASPIPLEHADRALKQLAQPGTPMTLKRVQGSYGGDSP